jgi:hypothetical protein
VLHRCTDINARPQGTKKQKQGNITPPKEANNFLENIRKKKGGAYTLPEKELLIIVLKKFSEFQEHTQLSEI